MNPNKQTIKNLLINSHIYSSFINAVFQFLPLVLDHLKLLLRQLKLVKILLDDYLNSLTFS